MDNVIAIMRLILLKLVRMDKWGGSHTELRNLTKGLPLRYIMTPRGKKLVQKTIKELNNKGFLIAKQSTGEIHVSLNPKMAKDINTFLQKFKRDENDYK